MYNHHQQNTSLFVVCAAEIIGVGECLLRTEMTTSNRSLSCRALLDEADYSHRPAEFDALIRTLSSELRLITPTNPDGEDEETTKQADPQQKYYQLTHDYLVRSLREWLGRKQRETRRGRSELCLEERAAIW